MKKNHNSKSISSLTIWPAFCTPMTIVPPSPPHYPNIILLSYCYVIILLHTRTCYNNFILYYYINITFLDIHITHTIYYYITTFSAMYITHTIYYYITTFLDIRITHTIIYYYITTFLDIRITHTIYYYITIFLDICITHPIYYYITTFLDIRITHNIYNYILFHRPKSISLSSFGPQEHLPTQVKGRRSHSMH